MERAYPAIFSTPEGTFIRVKVNPRSSRNEILDLTSDRVRIKLTASPVEGEANKALLKFFARAFRVPQADVEIVAGHRSRHKTIRVKGLVAGEVLKRLESKGGS